MENKTQSYHFFFDDSCMPRSVTLNMYNVELEHEENTL